MARPFDVLFIRHGGEVACIRQLYSLFQSYCRRLTEEEKSASMVLHFLKPPHDKFHIVGDSEDGWRELYFERWKRMKMEN